MNVVFVDILGASPVRKHLYSVSPVRRGSDSCFVLSPSSFMQVTAELGWVCMFRVSPGKYMAQILTRWVLSTEHSSTLPIYLLYGHREPIENF